MSVAVPAAESDSAPAETAPAETAPESPAPAHAETVPAETTQAESAPADTAPESPAPAPPPDTPAPEASPLTLRQEEFCRHYAATGNAAGAAREAGYAEGSARQTGHDLLARPEIAGRVRAIRAAWRDVEREEAQILLGRLEQAWDVAVEQGSASLMLRAIKLQADLSGLDRRTAHRRAGLWPLPGEVTEEAILTGAGETDAAADATEAGLPADPPAGPLAEAVRRGRHRSERALALHRANRKDLAKRKDFDQVDWLATAHRLHSNLEERRSRNSGRADRRPASAMTNPDISLQGPGSDAGPADGPDAPDPADPDISLHGSLRGSAGDAAPAVGPDAPEPADPDISLHRAGLMPEENGGRRVIRVPRPRYSAPFFDDMAKHRPKHTLPDYIEYTEEEWEEKKELDARVDAILRENDDGEDWRKHYTPGHDES